MINHLILHTFGQRFSQDDNDRRIVLSSARQCLPGNSQKRSSLITALVDDATTERQHYEESGSRLCVVQWSTSLKFSLNRGVWIRNKERDDEETSVVICTLGSTTADSMLSIDLQDWSTDCVCSVCTGKTFDVTSADERFVQVRREEVDDTRRSVQS